MLGTRQANGRGGWAEILGCSHGAGWQWEPGVREARGSAGTPGLWPPQGGGHGTSRQDRKETAEISSTVSLLSQGHLGDPSASGTRGPPPHFLQDPTFSVTPPAAAVPSSRFPWLLSVPPGSGDPETGEWPVTCLPHAGSRIQTPQLPLRKPAPEPRRDSGANPPSWLLKSGAARQKANEQGAGETRPARQDEEESRSGRRSCGAPPPKPPARPFGHTSLFPGTPPGPLPQGLCTSCCRPESLCPRLLLHLWVFNVTSSETTPAHLRRPPGLRHGLVPQGCLEKRVCNSGDTMARGCYWGGEP